MNTGQTKDGLKTRAAIIDAAVTLARQQGLAGLRLRAVAAQAEVMPGSVIYHFLTMRKLRDAVVARAIVTEDLDILGYALAAHDPAVTNLSAELRKRVAKHIAGSK